MRPEGGVITDAISFEFPNESIAQCGRRRRAQDWPWDRFGASPARTVWRCPPFSWTFIAGDCRFFAPCGPGQVLGGEVGSVEVVLAGDPDQREQGIAPGVGQRRAHPVRGGCLGDGADRPVRGDPFPRGMRQHGGQVDDARALVDRGGLHGGDLMLAQGLAHDVETARQRGIAERLFCLRPVHPSGWSPPGISPDWRVRPAPWPAPRPSWRWTHWSDAWRPSTLEEIEADGARFRALGPDAVADRLLGILRHQPLEFGLGPSHVRGCAERVRENTPANSAQELEALMSTMRTASIRGLWRLDTEQPRGLAALDAAPELLLSGHDEVLVERVGMGS